MTIAPTPRHFPQNALATASDPTLATRLEENTADEPIAAPVLIAQGLAARSPPRRLDGGALREQAAGGRLPPKIVLNRLPSAERPMFHVKPRHF